MNLNLVRRGRKFFFITLVVKDRRPLLSRREADKIVELLPFAPTGFGESPKP